MSRKLIKNVENKESGKRYKIKIQKKNRPYWNNRAQHSKAGRETHDSAVGPNPGLGLIP